jgi:hypothetical protein
MTCFYRILRLVHWVTSKLCPPQRRYTEVPASKLPWFWVGTTLYNEEITVTDLVNRVVKYNDRITPQLLREITGYNTADWKYIDAVTLEEKDFPPSGIVIEDAP